MPNTAAILIGAGVIAGGLALSARSKGNGKATGLDLEALETHNDWKEYVRTAIRAIDKQLMFIWIEHEGLVKTHLTRIVKTAHKLAEVVSAYDKQDEKVDIESEDQFLKDFAAFFEKIREQNFDNGSGFPLCATLLDLKSLRMLSQVKQRNETDTSAQRDVSERIRNIEMEVPRIRREQNRYKSRFDSLIRTMGYTVQNVVWKKVEEFLDSVDE